MYQIDYSNRFNKDLKRCMKRGLNIKLIKDAIDLLAANGRLPQQYRPHKLRGDMCSCKPAPIPTYFDLSGK
ncbi:MAG: type II toxin-antitoxin system YafQ family toxin [Prevotella sp.]|nr:type II toxin-antitoxin system YafQ family toxin [Prevotella sp.]